MSGPIAEKDAARLTDEQVDELVRLTDAIAAEDPYALDTLVGTVESWIDATASRREPPVPDVEKDARARGALVVSGNALQAALYSVDSTHQFHGAVCLCGFQSPRSRSRTEHITTAVMVALARVTSPGGSDCTHPHRQLKETPMTANIQIVPMNVNCPVCFARAGQSCQEREGFKEPAHGSRQIAAVAALATGEYARLLAPKPEAAR